MNRNAPATQVADGNKRHVADICWSSEWSFVEDVRVALQKPAQPPAAKKQPAGSYTGGRSNPW